MRPLAIVCGLLLAACPAAALADEPAAPQARFSYGDLNLRSQADRLTLASRVDQAAAEYCRNHSAVVTPYHRRGDRAYCRASIRTQLIWAMPPRVRRAYDALRFHRPAG